MEEGEKVVFTAKLSVFGTEKGMMLGSDSKFTLTNKSIIADNGAGVWTAGLSDDVISMAKVESGKFIFKSVYFAVDLNTEIVFAGGQAKLSGFQFYFSKGDAAKFEEIMNNLIG